MRAIKRKITTRGAMRAALLLFSGTLAAFCIAPAAPNDSRWGANYFPNVPLTTQDGKVVRFYDDLLKGRIVAIELIFTQCNTSCPRETARLAQVQKILGDRMGKDIFFYSISIDPQHDTPEVLKAYAEKFHAGPGWLFLTGKQEDIKLISKKLGLSSLTDADNPDGHQPSLMVGNEATGQWMRNSAVDNPRFLALMIGQFLDGWKNHKAAPRKTYAEAPQLNFTRAQYLFATKCNACHTIGKGDGVGPDLLGVTRTRDRAWLARWLAAPDQMLAEGDPIATQLFAEYNHVPMPNLRLNETDVGALIAYLEAQSSALQ